MSRPTASFTLPASEVTHLETLFTKGRQSVRSLKRAQVLLALHQGHPALAVANQAEVSAATVYNLRKRYQQEGLSAALTERPRSGQPSKFDAAAQAHLTALACSEAPEGRSRWTLRLLADRLVELRLLDSVSYKTVGEQLKKNRSNLGKSASGALVH